jgi:acetyl esterase/lipase
MKRTQLVLIIMTVLGAGVATLAQDAYTQRKPDRKVVYKTIGDVELELHVFEPRGHKTTDQRPAIIFFFGGGWKGGSPQQFYPHSTYFARRGMVAIAAEYRVAGKHKTTPAECVKDGKSAMRWLRKHAADLGIDPEKIVGGGGSAGAHVAAAAAMCTGFNEEGEDTSISTVPVALVLFNPVYDNSAEGYGHDRVKAYWQQISPRHNIDSDTPPTIALFGSEDNLIPPRLARGYQAEMKKHGVRSDLHIYDGQKHGFFNFAHREMYIATVTEADRFLVSLGLIEGEPIFTDNDRTPPKTDRP